MRFFFPTFESPAAILRWALLWGASLAIGAVFVGGKAAAQERLPAPYAPDAGAESISLAAPGNYPQPPDRFAPPEPMPAVPIEGGLQYALSALGRAYYANDQRIQFTGQEETFGAEGILAGNMAFHQSGWDAGLFGELFLNQPFDRNLLVDNPIRQSFRGNFETEPLEISQLYVTLHRGDLLFALGKMMTPFGRTYFPLYRNDRSDAPFIRTESILWRETGLLMQYEPGPFVGTVALVNGSLDKDNNSSKAIISRIGMCGDSFAAGASIKWQDGIGSEGQKFTNNHMGVDGMLRRGPWVLSGEAIYDEYGARRPFDPLASTWGRSLYNRDVFAPGRPITGVGYYLDLGYHGDHWTMMLDYGEFYPEQIGNAIQDRVTRRGIGKFIRHWSAYLDAYAMVMLENDIPVNQANSRSRGIEVLCGLQIAL